MATRSYVLPLVVWSMVCSALLLAGCSGKPANPLAIVSPHSREIQNEFERLFKAQHPEVTLQWIGQGGTTDALRMVEGQAAGKSQGQGSGFDVFFGGGAETFLELDKAGLLQPLPSDYTVPAALNGVPLRGQNKHWVAAALSGFGILYNKDIAARDKLPVPAVWSDLGDPRLVNRIELADPRHSGSAHAAYEIILQTNGWVRGWQVLTSMAANARTFIDSSTQLLQDVGSGEAVMTPAIDFYARGAIAHAGAASGGATAGATSSGNGAAGKANPPAAAAHLGYVEPRGQSVMTPDPIAILRGAPHPAMAQAFVDMVMSPAGQKLWLLKKGTPGGPVENDLYRQAALPALYKPLPLNSLIHSDPYALRSSRPYQAAKAAVRRQVVDDLIGAVLIDNHDALQARWKQTPDAARVAFLPITETEAAKLAAHWKDAAFRNKEMSQWSQAASRHYSGQ